MSLPAEPVPEWCWRSNNFQPLLSWWTCHFMWQNRRSLLHSGRHIHVCGIDWHVNHNLLVSDLDPNTREEPCSTLICACFMSALTGASDYTNHRTMDICPGSLLLEHHQPATPRISVCINQCNDELVFSGEPLLCALSDLQRFPNVISSYHCREVLVSKDWIRP